MNFLNFCLSEKICISSFLKDIFAGYSILGWQFFFFFFGLQTSNLSFHFLLAYNVSDEKFTAALLKFSNIWFAFFRWLILVSSLSLKNRLKFFNFSKIFKNPSFEKLVTICLGIVLFRLNLLTFFYLDIYIFSWIWKVFCYF